MLLQTIPNCDKVFHQDNYTLLYSSAGGGVKAFFFFKPQLTLINYLLPEKGQMKGAVLSRVRERKQEKRNKEKGGEM